MKAYIFPGQGSQFPGMGKDLYEQRSAARDLMEEANTILGFRLTDIMFSGTAEELKQTRVTQPAVFLHSVALALSSEDFSPDMVAGHSLGEFSALVSNGVLPFAEGLRLVARRAAAMQEACELQTSTMSAVIGMEDEVVEKVCAGISGDVVVAANFNCPGQVVISGTVSGVAAATEALKSAGARLVKPLQVSGAFHSPLMAPAREQLAEAIRTTAFGAPRCPVYQNVDAKPYVDVNAIRQNLIDQLTSPVRWTQSVRAMAADGASEFIECGPGKVLQGLVSKISPEATVRGL